MEQLSNTTFFSNQQFCTLLNDGYEYFIKEQSRFVPDDGQLKLNLVIFHQTRMLKTLMKNQCHRSSMRWCNGGDNLHQMDASKFCKVLYQYSGSGPDLMVNDDGDGSYLPEAGSNDDMIMTLIPLSLLCAPT